MDNSNDMLSKGADLDLEVLLLEESIIETRAYVNNLKGRLHRANLKLENDSDLLKKMKEVRDYLNTRR